MLKIVGNFTLDLAKLLFAGVVIGSLMAQDLDITRTALLGGAMVVVFAAVGFSAHYFDDKSKKLKP
jgi:type II secretory pathway component PulM